MSAPFPSPTQPRSSRSDVFLEYLDYYRTTLLAKLDGLSDDELRSSQLRSGWTPLELLKHLINVERRWLIWGFNGQRVPDPWADERDGRWHVQDDEGLPQLMAALKEQATITSSVVLSHDLSDLGQPSERWAGEDPPTLERILFHLLQEYARHVGHIDVVRELIDGETGE